MDGKQDPTNYTQAQLLIPLRPRGHHGRDNAILFTVYLLSRHSLGSVWGSTWNVAAFRHSWGRVSKPKWRLFVHNQILHHSSDITDRSLLHRVPAC